jgi:hypothetical protein
MVRHCAAPLIQPNVTTVAVNRAGAAALALLGLVDVSVFGGSVDT